MKTQIGEPVRRREDLRLLRGRGRYVDDIHVEGQLHAVILRSPWAHGRIRSIDVSAALESPGVVGVFTHADFGEQLRTMPLRLSGIPGVEAFLQRPIAVDKVRFAGEPVAVVVAETAYLAEDALPLIEVDVEDLPPVLDWESALEAPALLHEAAGRNTASVSVSRGDADAAFRDAPYTRRESFKIHRHTAIPMETRGLLAEWNEAEQVVTVWGATKIPFYNRSILASMMELPEAAVVMKVTDVGGGFGVRGEFYPEDFLIPFLARKLRRPVKWIEDRQEHFLAANHSREASCNLEIACDLDGTILGLRGEVMFDIGAYIRGTGTVSPTRSAQFLPGPYTIANFACTVNVYVSNKTPIGTYRGPGRVEANFFRERLIDMAARDLGLDPAAMRRSNLVPKEAMPYDIGRLVAYEGPVQFDSGDYIALFDEALREIGWQEKAAIQGRMVDGWYHGIGLAPFSESSSGGPKEHARLVLGDGGGIDLFVGSTNTGQGHETVFSQICADELQLPMDAIRVICASTDQLVDSIGTFHSRSAMMAGNAVRITGGSFRKAIEALAADYLGRPNVPVEWRDGAFFRNGEPQSVTLADLARFAAERGEKVDVTDVFLNETLKPFSGGTHAVHVAVDPRTGRVKVLDCIAVEDIGKVLNPLLAHGQALGAMVQGLGGVMLEHLQYNEEGQLLTASFADYLMPTATDFPNVRSKFMDLDRAPGNPLGVKGGGEGGIVAIAAAVANAVSAALAPLGVEVRELPLTPSRVWKMIRDAQA